MNERDSLLHPPIQNHLVSNLVSESMRKIELGRFLQINSRDNTIWPTPLLLSNTPILHILPIMVDIPLYLLGDMATIPPCIRGHLPHLMGHIRNISALVMAPHHHIPVEGPKGVTQIEKRADLEGDTTTIHTGGLAMRTSTDLRESGAVRRERGTDSWKKGQGF